MTWNTIYDNIEFMEKQCSPVIRHFKNFFNRPRPYQIADKTRNEV